MSETTPVERVATALEAAAFRRMPTPLQIAGVTFDAPEGLVTIDGENHHITKTARIGEIRPDGLIYTVWDSGKPIQPDPYLKSYEWAKNLK